MKQKNNFRLLLIMLMFLSISSWIFSISSQAIMVEVEVTPPPTVASNPPDNQPNEISNNQDTPQPINNTVTQPTPPPVENIVITRPENTLSQIISQIPQISEIQVGERLNNFRNNPQVKQFASRTITPTAATAGVITIGVISLSLFSSTSDILPILNYFFNAIISIFSTRRKKDIKSWGIAYSSTAKKPLELAIIRLYESSTNRLKQTTVTDPSGRFYFKPESGKFYINATKPKYLFPSKIMSGINRDGIFPKLYFGEKILSNNTIINYSIPLDPEDSIVHRNNVLARIRSYIEKTSPIIGSLGILMSLFSLWVNPSVVNLIILLLYIVLLAFRKITAEKAPEPLGFVYDQSTNKPIAGLVIRVFESKYNKLLETKITDKKGAFSFLLPDGSYYIKIMSYSYSFSKKDKDNIYTGEKFEIKNGISKILKVPLVKDSKIQHKSESIMHAETKSELKDGTIFDYLEAHNKKLSDIVKQ